MYLNKHKDMIFLHPFCIITSIRLIPAEKNGASDVRGKIWDIWENGIYSTGKLELDYEKFKCIYFLFTVHFDSLLYALLYL